MSATLMGEESMRKFIIERELRRSAAPDGRPCETPRKVERDIEGARP
jgi:hypothetical protein